MMNVKFGCRSWMLMTSALAWANPALAQSAPPPVRQEVDSASAEPTSPDIVVTGTIIRGAPPVGSTVISVGHDEIVRTGLATTTDIVRSIPQISSLGAGEATTGTAVNNASQNTTKANSINLRGLGAQATLSLLDGRRLPPGGTAAQLFDPSTIPAIALGRIDVVADGASATYGSDAVAGVANFILRRDVEGLEVSGRYGFADNYHNQQFGLIVGHRWDSGSIMVAAEYTHNSELKQTDRPNLFRCNETAYGYANGCSPGGAPGNLFFAGTATTYGLPAGTGVGVTAAQLSAAPNRLNSALYQTSIPEQTRYSMVGSARQELGPVTLWAEGYYTRRNAAYSLGTPTIGTNVSVPVTNPNFIFVPGQSQTREAVQYSLINDYGPARVRGYEEAHQIAVGADFRLGGDWQLSAYYENNKNTEYLLRRGQVNTSLLRTALACTTPGICFNPYGSGGSQNATAADSFLGYINFNSYFNSDLVNAKVDGTLFRLPGGNVKLAVGGEYHRDWLLSYNFNTINGTSLSEQVFTANAASSRKVTSAYAEVIVPIFGVGNAIPGFHRLDIDVAVRYDRYSDFGGTTNPKAGVNWSPVNGVTLHASYGTSFRAPTVADISPLAGASVISSTTVAGAGRNVLSLVGGRTGLLPETATTWSGGIDFKPDFARGLNVSVNYYRINYRNIIDTPAFSNPAVFSNAALYSSFVTLNPTTAQLAAVTGLAYYVPAPFAVTQGNVYAIVDGRRTNVGAAITSGIDIATNYRFDSDIGSWNLGATGTYVFNYNYQLVPGAPFIARLNQANFPLRFRARGQIGWSRGGVDFNAFINYSNPYNVVGILTAAQNDRVSAYTTVDGTLSYTFGPKAGALHDLSLSVSAQNLFNRKPPLALIAQTQQYDPGVASAIGRLISFNIRKKF